MAMLGGRAIYLQLMHKDFLQTQGDARLIRTVPIPVHRGMLLDRHGEPLAVSTPVSSVWVNPKDFLAAREYWPHLAKALKRSPQSLGKLLEGRERREFVYVERHIPPEQAEQIRTLDIPGVFLQREFRRFYPAGEVTAHVLGFTNIDDIGQEGLELSLNDQLQGTQGRKRVMHDRRGRIISDIDLLQSATPGKDIHLTIDRRLAYLVYRELKAAVAYHQAKSGSAVMLDAQTGEVLALINQPTYNPNDRTDRDSRRFRNRAITDVFEPGSTLKPFTIAAALESGQYTPDSLVDTGNGYFRVNKYEVRDEGGYGWLSVANVVRRSSNVGAAKIALSLEPVQQWEIYADSGFGEYVGSGFPGEVKGRLPHYDNWLPHQQASMAFGYGLNVTLLQLARAYLVIANDGFLTPLRFVLTDEPPVEVSVMSPETAWQLRKILASVTAEGGTGKLAQAPGYLVAGKTGTAQKSIPGGYAEGKYISMFVGIAPVDNPRLVMAIMLDEPSGGQYYGGEVAAPVFAATMINALRLLNVPPEEAP
ncbi:MAG: penicillin-binding protein 2 [Pseudomonadota bacterium]